MYKFISHPALCACCGGGVIEIDTQGWEKFLKLEDLSFGETVTVDPQDAFAGGLPGVNLITEAEILDRKDSLDIPEADWSYLSSLFFDDADFYGGLFFKWGDELGTAPTLTYSFVDGGTFNYDANYTNDADETGMTQDLNDFVTFANSDSSHHMIEFSADEKEFIRDTLDAYKNVSGIQFVEVDDNNSTSYGDLRFYLQDFAVWQETGGSYGAGGFAYSPWGDGADNEWSLSGDIFLDSKYEPYDGFFETTVTHEIGHALGLSHPFGGYGIIGNSNDSLDNPYTVMTYDRDPALLGINPMPTDIMAMEFLYGGTNEANLDDTSYWLDPGLFDVWSNDLTVERGWSYGLSARMSIVDDGGADIINANDITNGIFLNLSPGSWSNLSDVNPFLLGFGDDGSSEQIASSFDTATSLSIASDADILNYGQVYIESETYIEQCNLTDYGDIIFDNSTDNIIRCEGGDDLVSLSFGSDQVFGGEGNDEVSIYGDASDYFAQMVGAGYELLNTNFSSVNYGKTIYLESVENISFYGANNQTTYYSDVASYYNLYSEEEQFDLSRIDVPYHSQSTIVGLADGGFIVAWVTTPSGGGSGEINYQKISTSGEPVTPIIQVAEASSFGSDLQFPDVCQLSDGNIAFLYSRYTDGHRDIKFSLYDLDGNELISEKTLDPATFLGADTLSPKIIDIGGGQFAISYTYSQNHPQTKPESGWMQFFDNNGELAEQWANPWRITPQELGTSIADTDFNDGIFVSTWVNSVTQAVGFSFFEDAGQLNIGGGSGISTFTLEASPELGTSNHQFTAVKSFYSDEKLTVVWTDGNSGLGYAKQFDMQGNELSPTKLLSDYQITSISDIYPAKIGAENLLVLTVVDKNQAGVSSTKLIKMSDDLSKIGYETISEESAVRVITDLALDENGNALVLSSNFDSNNRPINYTVLENYFAPHSSVENFVGERIDLGSGSDKFYGGDEFDLVSTNGGADWVMAGAGDDMVIVNGTVLSTDKNPFDGRSNYVLIDTGTGDDIVEITTDFAGEVQLVSGGGSDTLVIEGESASYSWGADKDNLVLTSADATLVLTNQMAYDENQVFSYIEFISVDPVTGEETSQIFQIDPNADPVEGGIVTLLGTDKDDTLEIEWDSGPASIAGLKGDDIIDGGMSDDNLDGGEGDDLLFGDSGDDSLAGGEGEDLLAGDHGSDLLFGGLGDDVYKIDLEYDGFLDVAGYDNVVLNEDGTINYELSPETPWDDVIGGVDTITDDGGADRIWITNFQPTLNPFDQYKEMLSIDSDGTLIMKWGWDAESPSSYQYTLKEGFEHQPFDPVVQAARHDSGYVVTKSNVNSTTEQPTYTWPVFAEKWQAENFYGDQYGWDVPPVVHKVTVDPKNIAYEDGSKGSALEHTKAQALEFWVPGPEGSFNEGFAPDFTSYPGMVNIADTLFYDKLDNEYKQGGDLSSLRETGQHTEFDLGRIETWPGFDDLPEATDPANPEIGTQEYYVEQFVLGNSDTYPSVGEMPFVDVINNNIVSMADLQNVVDQNYSNADEANNLYPASSDYSNDNAELAQGFKVTDFAVKDEYGNWVNTIESIVFTSPTGEQKIVDKYGSDILGGKKSVYDSLTDALKSGYGIEYFLSPSGVVDLGTVRTPTGFNADGTPKGFKETNNWKGADTDQSFFLIANADMAGLNDSGLGFNGSTADVSFTGDKDAADPAIVLSNDILMSGAAERDIMVGYDGWDYVDVMFGHGGDDSMMAEGGENLVVGGAGADKFIIEAKAQDTVIIGDHADVNSDNTDFELDNNGNVITTNDSYGDAVFFDFAWPALIPNPNYDPNGPVDAINNPEMIRDGDTYIEQLGNNHFKVHHKLENGEEINVEMYDVEGAYFSDGMGGIEYHALTTGRPITSDDFGKLDYEKNDVKFWVEHNDADYGGATTIAVVTTATKSITDPVTKEKISYEEPTVKWKGLASDANSFEFSDVTINVINVAQTDVTGAPIVDATVYGTAGIDLIIGDEFDNLIFGGDDNDIIFGGAGNDEIYGEGGDDVLIGDVGEDILYGDYHEDALKPAEELDTRGNVMNASELDGDDIIVGGAGVDKIDTGEGENVAASGDLSSVTLNAELDEWHTFLDYDEDDLPV